MAVNQGAIQLQITIAGKSLSISKSHLVSLHVKRVIGDAADDFTLEVFDETAVQVENLLIGSNLPTISVQYASSTELTKTIIFTGVCLDYNISFVGRSMMLSITGILMTTGDVHDGWWFDKANIEWCGKDIKDFGSNGSHNYQIDGKNAATFSNYKNNRDVCAIVVTEKSKDGEEYARAYFNPCRIFQRIIHKYNGDKLGSGTSAGEGYVGSYDSSSISNTNSDNKTIVWNYFIKKGCSPQATAAIMGNISQETGDTFNPNMIQGNGKGPAAGIFQWENINTGRDRWANLDAFAKRRNKQWNDLGVQLDFSWGEMNGNVDGQHYGDGWISKGTSFQEFMTMTDINAATEVFERSFERAGIPNMPNRRSKANGYYDLYKGTQKPTISGGGQYTLSKETELKTMPLINASNFGTLPAGTKVTSTTQAGDWCYIHSVSDDSIQGWVHIDALANIDSSYYVDRTKSSATPTSEIDGWGTNPDGSTKYVIAEYDETRWVADLDTHQSNETAAQYITRVLCKAAVTDTGVPYEDEVAGFKYWCDAKGHHFKALNYNDKSVSKLNISYGLQHSQIISFSISDIGSIAMVWGDKAKRNKVTLSTSATSDLYGDIITAGGENVLGVSETMDQKVIDTNKAELNWYLDAVPAIAVKSSSSQTDLDSKISSIYNDLSEYAITAEVTLWGEYAKSYSAGDFVDLVVSTASGQRHYSSGIYMITSLEDDISSAGYTQTMRLLKNVGKNVSSSTSKSTITTPDLKVDGKGNIIASYTQPNKGTDDTKKSSSGGTTFGPQKTIPTGGNNTQLKNSKISPPKKYHLYPAGHVVTEEEQKRDKEYDIYVGALYSMYTRGDITEAKYKEMLEAANKKFYG